MGIIGTVGKFAGGLNWIRIALIVTIAIMIFGAGYQYSNTKHAKQEAKQAMKTAETIAEMAREHADNMRALALIGAEKERVFSADIAEIKIHETALIEQIKNAQLTKPVAEVRVEACMETDGESDVQIVIANPFSDSFRLFWNQASRNLRPSGSTGTDPD